jgi:invasion protein IalB
MLSGSEGRRPQSKNADTWRGLFVLVIFPLVTVSYVLFFLPTAGRAQNAMERTETPGGMTYSGWDGGCSVTEIADVSCVMRQEARSASGELLGFVIFGHAERSRFLTIATIGSDAQLPFSVGIDDVPLAKVPTNCHTEGRFCVVVLSVDEKLLSLLMRGLVLGAQRIDGIRLSFPLGDFALKRRALL